MTAQCFLVVPEAAFEVHHCLVVSHDPPRCLTKLLPNPLRKRGKPLLLFFDSLFIEELISSGKTAFIAETIQQLSLFTSLQWFSVSVTKPQPLSPQGMLIGSVIFGQI